MSLNLRRGSRKLEDSSSKTTTIIKLIIKMSSHDSLGHGVFIHNGITVALHTEREEKQYNKWGPNTK